MAQAGARIVMSQGVPYIYDQTRGKLLSMARIYLRSGIKSRNAGNQTMRLEDGMSAYDVGDALPRNATITGITLNCEASSSWAFEIYKRGTPAPIASLSVVSGIENHSTSINVDVSEGDILTFKLNGSNIPFPRGLVELAWRI